jgi:DNA polymerase IV
MPRLVMHIDLDAFYAAVEQRDHPAWRGRPLVVGAAPGRRGVVATCSYEARRFGVHSAMPIAEAVRRLPAETVYVRPDMARYAEVSGRIMRVLGTLAPVVEPVSIDEAYLDVSGLERLLGPPEVVARRTKAAIREAVGLTASVGIGPNRLIAKLASDARKPDGLLVVRPEEIRAFLDPLPLAALRGVRAVTARRLGTQVHLQSNGIADDRVHPATERQSISKETTFAEDVVDTDVLRETLHWAAQEVGYLARHDARKGTVVTLKIRLHPFETHTRSRTLAAPTAEDRVIFDTAWNLYRADTHAGRAVRLIGLGLSGWTQAPVQPDLFADMNTREEDHSDDRLDATLDAIRRRFGRHCIQRGLYRRP